MKVRQLKADSIVAKALAALARAVFRHRALFLFPQILLCAACAFYTIKHLKFDASQNNLVGANATYHKNFLALKEEFKNQDDLVVVVESEDPDKNRQFVERLGARLAAETNLFRNVMFKGDFKQLGAKALLFAPERDLLEMEKRLKAYEPFVSKFQQNSNLVSLFGMVCTMFRTAQKEKNAQNDSLINALPALNHIVREARGALVRPGSPPSPGLISLIDSSEGAAQQIYITFAKGRIFLVTVQAPREDLNPKAVVRMRELIDQTIAEVPGVNVGFTGEAVLDHDQMLQSQKDTFIASVASLIICALIFIYGYQETGRPVKATVCLVVGLAYTMAFATATIGHLNILTVTFAPILIGLAIDYGVHLISRYEEELRKGKNEAEALTTAMIYTGQGILTGGFTTAVAFLAMGLTDFRGIQEMGIICGGGLLLCLIPMMTMLPVLLLTGRQNVLDHELAAAPPTKRASIEQFWLERPVWVVAATLVITVLAASQLPKLKFDYDLLNLQSAGLPAVEYEKKLLNAADKSLLTAAIVATNLDDALRLEAQINKLTNGPVVAGVESMTRFLTGDQAPKLVTIGRIKEILGKLHFGDPDPKPVDVAALSQILYQLNGYLGATHEVIKTNEPALDKQIMALRQSIEDLRKEFWRPSSGDEAGQARRLDEFQAVFFKDVQDTFATLQNQDNSAPLRVEDLPGPLHDRFVGKTGKFLIMVYPRKDIWQRENQKEFIEALEPIYPNVTGTPVQLYHYTELLKLSYEQAAKYSLIAVVFLILIHFRSVTCVILALVPVIIGSVWLGGIMGWLGIYSNPANIMTLPLVIGIGVTNGIHILNRYAEEQTPEILARSTGKAVLVSGLTAIAGFGSLMLGKHQGLWSLGFVMSIGLTTCMIAGLTFLPALLTLMFNRDTYKKQPSADST